MPPIHQRRRRARSATTGIVALVSLATGGLAQAAPSVTGFTLVNAQTDSAIRPVVDEDEITRSELPAQLSIRANVGAAPVGSVRFRLNGSVVRTENTAPYSLGGDDAGNYFAASLPLGRNTLRAEPFAGPNATGVAGEPRTIDVWVGQNRLPRITAPLRLVNASGSTIQALSQDEATVVDLALLPAVWTIVADAAPGSPVQSVRFTRAGTNVRIENTAPYAYGGDAPPGNFITPTLPLGSYEIRAIPWSQDNAAGVQGIFRAAGVSVVRSDIAVNSPVDQPDAAPGNGVCEATAGAGNCTLRAAVQESNARAGIQAIGIPPGLYQLSLGQLTIDSSTTLRARPGSVTIRQTQFGQRVMQVLPAAGTSPIVNLVGMELTGGRSDSFDRGAGLAIWNEATVQMFDMRVVGNQSNQFGGGIYVQAATLLARDIVVRQNTVGDGGFAGGGVTQTGGGLAAINANVTLERVRIEDNVALRAGGILVAGSRLRMTNGLVAGNRVGNGGGGLIVQDNGPEAGIADIAFSTITRNEANAPGGGGDDPTRRKGGGIFVSTGRVSMANSILAGNIDSQSSFAAEYSPDCNSETIFRFTSFRGNVLGQRTPNCIFRDTIFGDPPSFDQVGTPAAPLGPGLGFDNVPAPASAPLDRGDGVTSATFFDCPTHDLRGLPRPVDGIGDGVSVCDAGAFERQ